MAEPVKILRSICYKDQEKYGKIPFISRKLIHPYISIYITKLFLELGFSGLQVTILMLIVNLLAVLALFRGGFGFYVLGGSLLILGWILDHTDGEVCRYRNESTSLGIFLDRLTHRMTYPAIYLALGYSLFKSQQNINFLFLGIVASYFLNLTEVNRLDKKYISTYRKDIAFHHSSTAFALDKVFYRSGIAKYALYPLKYFVGMLLPGYGVYFNILLIFCACIGVMDKFFLFFAMLAPLNWLLNFIFDLKYTFISQSPIEDNHKDKA